MAARFQPEEILRVLERHGVRYVVIRSKAAGRAKDLQQLPTLRLLPAEIEGRAE